MTDPTLPPPPPAPPPTSKTASRVVLVTAVLALIGLSVAAWLMASTTDTDDGGVVGGVATDETKPTQPTESTPTLEPEIERYAALGDSMTSAPFLPVVDRAGGCLRSSQNYPSLVAEELQVSELVDVSCGGATTEDMRASQFGTVPPQLDAVTADTDLVTLTLGGNDFGTYRNVVISCRNLAARDPDGSPCEDAATANGGDALVARIEATGPRLQSVLEEIHDRAPEAQVVLVGYPRLFPTSGTCPDILPFASGDYAYLRSVMERFNQVQRDAAAATDTVFLDMYAASAGHDPCAADPWMNGAHTVQGGAAAFHPFPEGQAAIASELLDVLR